MRVIKLPEKKAFTLAEVLLTLLIIGIVSVLTIPSLISSIDDMQYKSAYKKAYSDALQAIQKLGVEGVLKPACSGWQGCEAANASNFAALKSEFNVAKDCPSGNNSDCWDNKGEKYSNNWPTNAQPAFIDASGMAWTMISPLHLIAVDVNGFKGPNKYGKDRIPFIWSDKVKSYPAENNVTIPTTLFVFADGAPNGQQCISGKKCYYRTWLGIK